jgi:hypothetical protein
MSKWIANGEADVQTQWSKWVSEIQCKSRKQSARAILEHESLNFA